jgi:hypothetical protein
VVPIGKELGALFVILATEQLSAVTGVPKLTLEAVHEVATAFTFVGAVIVGLVLSATITICVVVAVLPLPSVTVQITVVFPIGKVLGALLLTLTTEQLSAVDGEPKFTLVASHKVFVPIETSAGAVMVGFITSELVTVTVWVAVAVLPLPSVTVQVTTVVPIGNTAGALLLTLATEQLSAVTGVPKLTLEAVHEVATTFTFAGAVIVGLMLSVTVTVTLIVPALLVSQTAAPLMAFTEYTPFIKPVTLLIEIFWVFAVNPFGPVQLYEIAPDIELAFRFKVDPAHKTGFPVIDGVASKVAQTVKVRPS